MGEVTGRLDEMTISGEADGEAWSVSVTGVGAAIVKVKVKRGGIFVTVGAFDAGGPEGVRDVRAVMARAVEVLELAVERMRRAAE